MDWNGHDFAFVLRIDVEHREAERYTGDPRSERVATRLLLDVLEEFEARFTCAVLGITAELYPDIVRWCAARHEIVAHSMFHDPPYPELPLGRQRWDIRRTTAAIVEACGVRVRGLACPHHGLANDDTARAALDLGLEYLLGRLGGAVPGMGFAPYHVAGREHPLLVSGGQRHSASDWSGRRREWPWIEEPWSAGTALRRWMGLIDRARADRGLATLVVHPWMLQINEGEVKVLQQVLRYAAAQGAWLTGYDRLADLARAAGVPAAGGE